MSANIWSLNVLAFKAERFYTISTKENINERRCASHKLCAKNHMYFCNHLHFIVSYDKDIVLTNPQILQQPMECGNCKHVTNFIHHVIRFSELLDLTLFKRASCYPPRSLLWSHIYFDVKTGHFLYSTRSMSSICRDLETAVKLQFPGSLWELN